MTSVQKIPDHSTPLCQPIVTCLEKQLVCQQLGVIIQRMSLSADSSLFSSDAMFLSMMVYELWNIIG